MRNGKSTIDLIFSDMTDVMEVGVRPVIISDHLPIYIVKKKGRNCKNREWAEFRHDMKNYYIEALENIIRADGGVICGMRMYR